VLVLPAQICHGPQQTPQCRIEKMEQAALIAWSRKTSQYKNMALWASKKNKNPIGFWWGMKVSRKKGKPKSKHKISGHTCCKQVECKYLNLLNNISQLLLVDVTKQ